MYDALAAPLADGSIHELRIKTLPHKLSTELEGGDDHMSELREQIKQIIETEPVSVFMKGTPQLVMCGNSDRALRALKAAGAPITAVDVLPDPRIRQELSALSGWPTIRQVFVGGELVGGADIVEELYESGELRQRGSTRRWVRSATRPSAPRLFTA